MKKSVFNHNVPLCLLCVGNVQDWEMPSCLEHSLIPTVCTREALEGMALALRETKAEARKAVCNGFHDSSDEPNPSNW